MSTLVYSDAYLAKFCTSDREVRALVDVDALGTFAEPWRSRLGVLKCYVLACLENQADAEDLFTAKLRSYRAEFETVLTQARSATPDDEGNILPIYSLPIERA